jgi:hypothetical protein
VIDDEGVGSAVELLVDMNGDGYGDLAAGAPGALDSAGAVTLWWGGAAVERRAHHGGGRHDALRQRRRRLRRASPSLPQTWTATGSQTSPSAPPLDGRSGDPAGAVYLVFGEAGLSGTLTLDDAAGAIFTDDHRV